MFSFGSPPFVRLREQFWLAVLAEAAAADRSLVFTFTPEDTVQAGFPERVRNTVEGAGGQVRWVRLLVSDAEQVRRIDLPSRREFHKLRDPALLRGERPAEIPPVDLAIDTDRSTAAESAARVVTAFGLRPRPPVERCP